jgi:hypothetical protein
MSTLVKLKRFEFSDDAVEMIQDALPLCHCNDMEYNPEDQRIYVVCGNNSIAVVNPESLTVDRTIPIGISAWSIARYANGDFFIHDGMHSRRYDSRFENYLYISRNDLKFITNTLHVPYDPVEKSYAGYWQGAFMMDGKAHLIYTEWNGIADQIDSGGKLVYNGDSRFKSCVLYAPETGELHRFPTFQEAEGACVAGNELCFVLGNEYFGTGVYNMSCSEEHYDTFATVHREIPTGENLNQMFTPGLYRSKNAGKTKTLVNLPNVQAIKDAGFYMEIWNVGLNHIRQTIYSDNFWDTDIVLTRGYCFDYGWGPWYKYNMTKV